MKRWRHRRLQHQLFVWLATGILASVLAAALVLGLMRPLDSPVGVRFQQVSAFGSRQFAERWHDPAARQAFAREHIPGAISLPHREMDAETTRAIDRKTLVVTYCDGIGCNASTKGALKLSQLGFKVKELIGGLDWWRRDGYATAGAQARAGTVIECAC